MTNPGEPMMDFLVIFLLLGNKKKNPVPLIQRIFVLNYYF
jgi:hypothetical protein